MTRWLCLLLPVLLLPCAANGAEPAAPAHPITVADIYQKHLLGEPPSGMVWSPDGTRLTYLDEDGNLVQAEGVNGQKRVLVSKEKIGALGAGPASETDRDHRARYHQASYLWVPDSKHLLFDSGGQLWFFDLATGTGLHLASTGEASGDDPKFSPDGSYVSYIHEHNLYTRHMRESQVPLRLSAAQGETLLNGEVDWVYEEELDVRSNYFWSPDSRQVAYLQTNEANVPAYPITDWIPTHALVEPQRYPQPGDPNPAVRVGVVNANGGKTTWLKVPLEAGNDYIPRFGWVNPKTLWVETLSRDHRRLTLYFADNTGMNVRPVLTQTDDKFFDEAYDVTIQNGHILLTSWRDGHNHIYLYSFDRADPLAHEATLEKQLTKGDWDVDSIQGVDEAARTVYYLSNEGDPREQQIWAVTMDGSDRRQVSATPGTHKPIFSPNAKFYADTASSTMSPPEVKLCRHEAECTSLWKSKPVAGIDLIAPAPLELKSSDGATTLYGSLVLPPDRTAAASVPLIVNPYGGPHAQTVKDEWNPGLLFDTLLAQHGFATLHVDNRGMGGRGRDFAQAAYHNMGPVQFGDQMAAIDQVLARYSQLDAKRLGWWGWSWGGTFTLYAMTHSDRFAAGVSVAPVTDWRNYDSIYTERYMGLPAANEALYRVDSVVNDARHLKGRLLIAHGTGDDNVHIENSVQFIQQLITADLPYDFQIYPRKTHSIAGPEARTQLFDRIVAQFEQYLLHPQPAAATGQQ